MENEFKRICSINELNESQGKRFIVDNIDIAVFKMNGEVYALSNICPHQHSPIIYDGFIEDGMIVCPAHGWEFELKTGKLGGERRGLSCFDVKVEDDEVFVKVYIKELKW